MSFTHNSRTFRSSKTYNQNIFPKMSVSAENVNSASEQSDAEEVSTNDDRFFEVTKEMLRVNLEPMDGQISKFTLLINQLIQDSSVKTIPTAGSRTNQPQPGLQWK